MRRFFTFYCDEFGNTGPDYVEDNQPFYVAAGFLIPDDSLVDVAVVLEQFRQEHAPQANELKSSSMFKRRTGAARVLEMLGKLGKRFAVFPMFVVGEKRYCVAAKIVDTFLDPPYNDRLNNAFNCDLETKQQLANDLLRYLDAETQNVFAEAYRHPSVENLSVALDKVVAAARAAHSVEVAELLEGARPHLADISSGEGWPSSDINGINLPALLSLFQMVEKLAQDGLCSITKFVHDETTTHEAAYRETFLMFKGLGDTVLQLPTGRVMARGLQSIPDFETQKSVYSMYLQAADLFAGAIGRLCVKVLRDEPFSDDERQLARVLFAPLFVVPDVVLAWALTSGHFLVKLATAIGLIVNAVPPKPFASADTLLPPVGANRPAQRPGPHGAVPMPTWGLFDDDGTPHTFMLAGDASHPEPRATLAVFSTDALALAFARDHDLADAVRVGTVGDPAGRDVVALVEAIEPLAPTTALLAIDPGDGGPWKLMHMDDVVRSFRGVVERGARVLASGAINVVRQEHCVNGKTYFSLLLSTGDYGVELPSSGRFVRAATREGAVALAVEQEEARPNDGADQAERATT